MTLSFYSYLFYFLYELSTLASLPYLEGETLYGVLSGARVKHLTCQSGFLTAEMVKVDFNAHGAMFSRVRVIFPTPHSVSSPEAISDRGWT